MRGGHGLAVDGDVGLVEVEPALAVHEERQLALGDGYSRLRSAIDYR